MASVNPPPNTTSAPLLPTVVHSAPNTSDEHSKPRLVLIVKRLNPVARRCRGSSELASAISTPSVAA
jgi:hypothetical protein